MITLRNIKEADAPIIEAAFRAQGWNKKASKYLRYFQFQENGIRDVILAEWKGEFAGYLTIAWISGYPSFKEKKIPEIQDLNVLKKFQRKGIANAMMDEAENRIKARSPLAGIGVGMHRDYGPAQIMYIHRGYIPDGRGMMHDELPIEYEMEITVYHNLALYLTKRL